MVEDVYKRQGKSYTVFGLNLFDLFDFVTAKLMLPLGGFFISICIGWYLDKKIVWEEVRDVYKRQNHSSSRPLSYRIRHEKYCLQETPGPCAPGCPCLLYTSSSIAHCANFLLSSVIMSLIES